MLGGGGKVSSTGGSAGAIGATVARGTVATGTVDTGTVATVSPDDGSATGSAVGAATMPAAGTDVTSGACREAPATGVTEPCAVGGANGDAAVVMRTCCVVFTGAGLPVGSVTVPSGDGNCATGVESTKPGSTAAAAADVAGVAGSGPDGSASWLPESIHSATPNAAVIPRIAVAEIPVERILADLATWRCRFFGDADAE